MVSALSVMDGGGVGNGDAVCVYMRVCICVSCRYIEIVERECNRGPFAG